MYAPKSPIIRWELSEVNFRNPHLNTINKKTTEFSQQLVIKQLEASYVNPDGHIT